MKYILHGNPVPLARPRMNGRIVYDSQRKLKGEAIRELESQLGDEPKVTGPVTLQVTFFLKIPKKSSKTNKLCNRLHIYRPDLSNLIKFLEDVCNKLLYDDDCIIARIDATKRYDHEPRTEFELLPIEEEENDD